MKTFTTEEVIKLVSQERKRARDIAYKFYERLNKEINSLEKIGTETGKIFADRRKGEADICRQIGNAISGAYALTPQNETIEDRIREDLMKVTDVPNDNDDNNTSSTVFSFNEKVVWESGFGYEIAYFLGEGVDYDTYLIDAKIGLVYEPCSYPKCEIHKYSDELIDKLAKKYGYEKRFLK